MISQLSIPETALASLSKLVEENLGLHYPRHRYADLERGLRAASTDLGFADARLCLEEMLSTVFDARKQKAMVSALTIGETYFLREQRSAEVLEQKILPQLIASRRGNYQTLRCWSAGCSTGEEPYSLAIALRRLLPDIKNWKVDILATDINQQFLNRAAEGVFTEWSFRGTSPAFRVQHFNKLDAKRYGIREDILKMVRFSQFNLASPSFQTLGLGWDLILCRNVLIYFAPDALQTALLNFHKSLGDCGWLLVGPTEASYVSGAQFRVVRFPGFCAYQRARDDGSEHSEFPPLSTPSDGDATLTEAAYAEPATPAQPIRFEGCVGAFGLIDSLPAAESLLSTEAAPEKVQPTLQPSQDLESLAEMARSCADEGRLAESLALCDRALLTQKSNASIHYLRASVLSEMGELSGAIAGFKRALYLDPDFALAHFALGNLYRRLGDQKAALKSFENALSILLQCEESQILAEADGLTVRRLAEVIHSIIKHEVEP